MKAPKSYEEGMERLNAILAKMQDEQTTLAEAVKLYAEAASLMEYCHTALEKTSLQIEEIDAKITQTRQEQREENSWITKHTLRCICRRLLPRWKTPVQSFCRRNGQ